jgi:hypothetical protein
MKILSPVHDLLQVDGKTHVARVINTSYNFSYSFTKMDILKKKKITKRDISQWRKKYVVSNSVTEKQPKMLTGKQNSA